MNAKAIFVALLRRWYLVLIGLVLTLIACFQVQLNTPQTYRAQGSLVMMPSPQSVGVDGNPYLKLGGMGEALDILTRRLSAEDVKDRISQQFPESKYTAETDRSTSGAILLVTATSSDPEQAMNILGAVMDQAPSSLREMQDALNVPSDARISTMPLVVDSSANPETRSRLQLLLAVGVGSVGLTLVLTVLADGFLLARKKKTDQGVPARARRPGRRNAKQAQSNDGGTNTAAPPPLSDPTIASEVLGLGSSRRGKDKFHETQLLGREEATTVPSSQRPS